MASKEAVARTIYGRASIEHLAAAAIVVVGQMLQLPIAPVTALALILCFLFRVLAIKRVLAGDENRQTTGSSTE